MTTPGQTRTEPARQRTPLSRRACVALLSATATATVMVTATAAAMLATPAQAQAQAMAPPAPAELAADMPQARLQGSGRLRFLGLRIYDARLWSGPTPVGAEWAAVPLALELEYARGLAGTQIAERSLVEMRRQAEPTPETAARWLAAMKAVFPDVREGDRITGVNVPGLGARFFHNGRLRGEVLDPDFARQFFGIWLSPRSSEPALRAALLGTGPAR